MSTKRATVQSIRGYFMENYNEEFPEEAPFVEAFKSWPEDQNPLQGTGIDSLDVLDIVFAIDKEYRVKLPLEKWSMALSQGKTRDPDGNEWMSFASIASEVNRLLDEQAAATDTSYTAALSH